MNEYSTSFNVESKFPLKKVKEKFPEVQSISFEQNGVFLKCTIKADLPEDLTFMINFDRLSEISRFANTLTNKAPKNKVIPNEILEVFQKSAEKFVPIGELANYIGKGGKIKSTSDFRKGIITRTDGTTEVLKFSLPVTKRLVKGEITKIEFLKLQVTDILNVNSLGEEFTSRKLLDFNGDHITMST